MIFPDASEIFPFPSETNFPHLRSRRNSKTLKIFLPSSNLNRFEFFAKRKVAEFQSIVWMSKNRLIRKIIYYIYRIKFDCHSSIGDWYFGKSRNFIFSQTSVSHSHYVCCSEKYPFLAWLRICSMVWGDAFCKCKNASRNNCTHFDRYHSKICDTFDAPRRKTRAFFCTRPLTATADNPITQPSI